VTDRPYTDDDLRAEAARQLTLSTEDPDFMGIGERMEWTPISSRPDDRWDDLDREDFDTAQRAIHGLLGKAADLSGWAIDMGADGLEPADECLSLKGDGKPIVRIHFAFDPAMPDDVRQHLISGVAQAIDAEL
jgi:hypothetical protein